MPTDLRKQSTDIQPQEFGQTIEHLVRIAGPRSVVEVGILVEGAPESISILAHRPMMTGQNKVAVG